MSTSGGLSRRRVGGTGGGTPSSYNDDDDNKLGVTNGNGGSSGGGGASRSITPPPPSQSVLPPHHVHAGSAFQGGNKIAFDPRDLQQDASEEARTGGKMPRLTIMEEVLLLGIKDKQVETIFFFFFLGLFRLYCFTDTTLLGLSVILERQHFIRSTWLYSHRTGSSTTYSSSQRFQSTADTSSGPYYRSRR
jgi:hypothetical protein